MQTYIWLLNFTEHGIETINDLPTRDEEGKAVLESLNIEMKDHYYALGQYDEVVVFDAPDDETAAQAALMIGSEGNVSTETLKAFSEDEFHKIVENI